MDTKEMLKGGDLKGEEKKPILAKITFCEWGCFHKAMTVENEASAHFSKLGCATTMIKWAFL